MLAGQPGGCQAGGIAVSTARVPNGATSWSWPSMVVCCALNIEVREMQRGMSSPSNSVVMSSEGSGVSVSVPCSCSSLGWKISTSQGCPAHHHNPTLTVPCQSSTHLRFCIMSAPACLQAATMLQNVAGHITTSPNSWWVVDRARLGRCGVTFAGGSLRL